jgi:hypothetical protein
MAYTTDRRGFSRTGFRPVRTNPYAATFESSQLSLGQVQPFRSTPGYQLRGLGNIIPNQSIVTYRGKWAPGGLRSAEAAIGAVLSALTQDGFAVRDVSSDATADGQSFDVTLQLQVTNGVGFSNPSAIIAIVQAEVFTATGVTTLADAIPNVRVAHRGSPPSTQQQNASWLVFGFGLLLLSGSSGRRRGR